MREYFSKCNKANHKDRTIICIKQVSVYCLYPLMEDLYRKLRRSVLYSVSGLPPKTSLNTHSPSSMKVYVLYGFPVSGKIVTVTPNRFYCH